MSFTRHYTSLYILVALVCVICSLTIIGQMTSDMGREKERKCFVNFIVLYLIFCLSNGVCAWCNYARMPVPGYIFSIINQIAICRTVYHWFLYIESQLNPKLLDRRGFLVAINIPQIILFTLVATTPWTHLVFYYGEDGGYVWGPFHIAILIMSFAYLAVGSAHVMGCLRRAETQSQRRHYQMMILFMLFPIGAGLIDLFVPHLPVMELMAFLGIVIVFTNLQQSQIYEDNLTGIANRRYADIYLGEQLEQASPERPVCLFLADADKLKEINDRNGHQEGDHALILIAQTLRAVAKQYGGLAARWGGDEYVLILAGEETPAFGTVITQIEDDLAAKEREEALPYPLRLSIGYSQSADPGIRNAELLAAADAKLYEMKEQHRIHRK